MIGKGKSISHGTAALEYDLAKEIDGQTAAIEIARHELYGCTGAEMVQEMKPYHADFPNVKKNCRAQRWEKGFNCSSPCHVNRDLSYTKRESSLS